MKPLDPKKSVLLMIDMEKAFVEPGAALCIAGAKASVPFCASAVDTMRRFHVPVIWVKRVYAEDGSDMEIPRRRQLIERGLRGVLAPGSTGLNSIEEPDGLVAAPSEKVLFKPRFSAFFATGLADHLREAGICHVLLAGTTTPNCIRATCYDAVSYDFNAVILEACCSSQTPAIQRANIEDMARMGADIYFGTDFDPLFLPPR
jgi:nicotinamidase-related amidase